MSCLRIFLFLLLSLPAYSQCPDSAKIEAMIGESYRLKEKEDVAGAKASLEEAVRVASTGACGMMRLWALSEQMYLGHSLQDFAYLGQVSASADRYLAGRTYPAGSQEEEVFLLVRQYQATFYYENGDYEKAFSAYAEIFKLLEKRRPLTYETAKSLENATLYMASILKVWGEVSGALEWYLKSLDYSQECRRSQPGETVEYLTCKHIGDCFLLQGQAPQALSFYRKGYFGLRKFMRDNPSKAASLANRQAALLDAMTGYFLETGRFDSARVYLGQGLRLGVSPEMDFRLRMREVILLHRSGRTEEALGRLDPLTEEIKKYYGPLHPGLGEAQLLQAELLAASGRREEALQMIASALPAANHIQGLNGVGLQTRLFWEAYLETKEQHLLDSAYSSVGGAMERFDGLLRSWMQPGDRQSLVEKRYGLFELALLSGLEMHRLNPGKGYAEQAFLWAEQSKAVMLGESIRRSRELALRNASSPEEQTLRHQIAVLRERLRSEMDRQEPDLGLIRKLQTSLDEKNKNYEGLLVPAPLAPPSLQAIRRELLGKDRGLLAYFMGDSYLFAFLLTPGGLEAHSTPLADDTGIADWVKNISSYYDLQGEARQAALRDFRQVGYDLYRILLEPFEGKLPTRLWIIPDGELAALPFDALLTGDPGQAGENFAAYPFLIRKHILSYGFSAASLLAQKDRSDGRARKGLLAVAPEFLPSGKEDDLFAARLSAGALYFNIPQARSICKSWRGDSLLRGDATELNFLEKGPGYRILHLATHGQADLQRGERSFLLLGGGRDTLFAWELMAQALPAEMVVLSACETGAGQHKRGEGVIGLAWSFAFAGARSVVTSLWSVYDHSTANLMEHFYAFLARKQPKDEALRNAKLALLDDPEYAHPVHWAAFIPEGEMAPLRGSFYILGPTKIQTMLYTILQHVHSVWRWVILILVVWTLIAAFIRWRKGAAYTESDRKRAFFAMTATHLQLLFGLVLYFISPYVKFTGETMKDPILRFYSMEHILMMVIAIALISMGYSLTKKRKDDRAKFRTQFYYFLFGLLLILAAIPWPFRQGLSGAWF